MGLASASGLPAHARFVRPDALFATPPAPQPTSTTLTDGDPMTQNRSVIPPSPSPPRRATFAGVPSAVDLPPDSVARAAVLGAGTSLGSSYSGTENGPYLLRALSGQFTWSASQPHVLDVDAPHAPLAGVVDLGDVSAADGAAPGEAGGDAPDGRQLAAYQDALRRTVAGLPATVAPCVIGGDHSVTLAVVAGLRERGAAPFDVVQFDHHLDLQTWGEAPGGLDDVPEPLFNTNVMSHVAREIRPGRLTQLGIAPYTVAEAPRAETVRRYLDEVGTRHSVVSPVLHDDELFRRTVRPAERVYLTLDVDVLQATDMSSTAYPAVVGLSLTRLFRLIDLVLEGRRLIGFDLVEFGADRADRGEKTLADGARAATLFLRLLSLVNRPPGTGATAAGAERTGGERTGTDRTHGARAGRGTTGAGTAERAGATDRPALSGERMDDGVTI